MLKNRLAFYAVTLSSPLVSAKLSSTLRNALGTALATSSAKVERSLEYSLTDGTTANKADKVWGSDSRALTSGTNEEIDLYDLGSLDVGAGAGKDPLGEAWAIAEIVGFMVVSESNSVGNVEVGGATAATGNEFNSWVGDDSDKVKVRPGGFCMFFAPGDPAYAVADATNHKLKIAAAGGDVTYSIYVLARSA
jgi:hypothetical protein